MAGVWALSGAGASVLTDAAPSRDNMNVGYIYGSGVILSTHNAGLNWIAETPNPLIITSGINVQAIATGAFLSEC